MEWLHVNYPEKTLLPLSVCLILATWTTIISKRRTKERARIRKRRQIRSLLTQRIETGRGRKERDSGERVAIHQRVASDLVQSQAQISRIKGTKRKSPAGLVIKLDISPQTVRTKTLAKSIKQGKDPVQISQLQSP